MPEEKPSIDPRPTAQVLLGAVASAMRLSSGLDQKVGSTTRKAIERGSRVKPQTRSEYVTALASQLVHRGFPRVLSNAEITTEDVIMLVSGGIGEYCAAWDRCQSYFESYAPRGTDPLLTALPMLRLALQDLGVRLGLYGLGTYGNAASAFLEHAPAALVDGTAFMGFLRFQLRRRGMRRTEIIAEIGESSYETWEAGGLPHSANINRLAGLISRDPVDRGRLDLELRIVIALVELWRWLERAGLPEPHRAELAQSFVAWVVDHVAGFVGGIDGTADEKERMRIVGVLRGPREAWIGRGIAGLGRYATDRGFALDLQVLGGEWAPAIRHWHGFLSLDTGADDMRAGLQPPPPPHWSARDIVAWGIVSFHLEIEPQPYAQAEDNSSRLLEARGELALRNGDPAAAQQILESATRRFSNEPWLHIKLAEALEAQGKLREAEQEILVATGLEPTIQDAHLLRARILLSDQRCEEALAALAAAAQLPPENPVIPEFEGHALLALGRKEDALRAYIRSRELNPRHLPGWQGEATVLLLLDRGRDAEKAAKQAAHLGDGEILNVVREWKVRTARNADGKAPR